MLLTPTFNRKFLAVTYELNEEFYQIGMAQPTCHDCDAWWNLSFI